MSYVSPWPGAFATTLVLFGLICAVWIAVCVAWEAWQRWIDDRRMRRGMRAARKLGLLPEDVR